MVLQNSVWFESILATHWFLAPVYQHVDTSTKFFNTVVLCVFTTIVFTERVVNAWNSLPNTVDFNSLDVFKRTIKLVIFYC